MDSPILTLHVKNRDGSENQKVFVLDTLQNVVSAATHLNLLSNKLMDIVMLPEPDDE